MLELRKNSYEGQRAIVTSFMRFLVLKMLNNLIALNYMYLHEKYHMIETYCQCTLEDLFGGWVILLIKL